MTTKNDAADLLSKLLAECIHRGASDIHISPGLPPYFRASGHLEPDGNFPAIPGATTESLARQLMHGHPTGTLDTIGSVDGAVGAADGTRFRFNVYRRRGELAIALRRLEDRFRTLGELGLSESLYDLCNLTDGLVIVCGPTGAGKSTTLAALIDRINKSRRCHIVTIEDPIEYVHTSNKALVNQRQIGFDAGGFNDALVSSLRQDPDVILVGEIRDLATIRTAITASETGHLVLTTVHAGDCVGAVERLTSVFSAEEQTGIRKQLSMVLRAVIAQHLVVADGVPIPLSTDPSAPPPRRERVVVSEIMHVNNAVANLIATAKSPQIYTAMETGAAQGMHTLESDLARLWAAGKISEATATALARNPAVVKDRANALKKAPLGAPRPSGILK